MKPKRHRLSVKIESDLLAVIDSAAKSCGLTRSAYLQSLIRNDPDLAPLAQGKIIKLDFVR